MADLSALPRRSVRGFGWRRDIPDRRDYRVDDFISTLQPVPDGLQRFSLRDKEPEPCWNQSRLGSCVGHGSGFVFQFERAKLGLHAPRPSRLAIYYAARLIEGSPDQDTGCQIRDAIRALATVGAADEQLWPYDISKFAQQPPQEYLDAAKQDLALTYWRSPVDVATFKRLIYNGYPVVYGFSVYESFESDAVARTGLMPMPSSQEEIVGGHCTAHVGWDDTESAPGASPGLLEDRNSWDTTWGDAGHFWMPYQFASDQNLCDDTWVITGESGA